MACFDSCGGGNCLFLITIDYLSKTGISCDCEIEIIQGLCLHCKSFSPLHRIVKATRKKSLSGGFGSFLMEYLMKKTHRADEERILAFFLSKKSFV